MNFLVVAVVKKTSSFTPNLKGKKKKEKSCYQLYYYSF